MKARSKFFLFLSVLLLMILPTTSQAADYITNAPTPYDAVLKWSAKIGEGWQKSAGVPVLIDDSIVIISGDELIKLNKDDGIIIKRVPMAAAQSYGYVAPTVNNSKLYMNLSDGIIQAFDVKTLASEWVYKHPTGGKGMTAVTYSDGVVYTGFWHSETKDADFVALDSTDGTLLWSKTVNGGFYWASAYCTEKAVVFATDDGSDKVAHIYSCDKKTGEVISFVDAENKGDIRSAITYYNGRIYATTKGGYIISAKLENDILSDVKYGEIGAASTSTPVIYNDRIYIGAGDKTITVIDANTLEKQFSVPVTAYPQCSPLISTYYEADGYIYLYTTYNKSPGGITLIKIKADATSAEDCVVTELYNAKGYEQYCISDIICDEDGTLYYKNDSGYLFAVSDNVEVTASFSEDGFIFEPTKLSVNKNNAEKYGYTDTITDGVSTLDVLVKIHEEMLGDEFTPDLANEYLSVSEEGYLSRVMGVDTYSFGFAVNGGAPHDDVLTEYGYTGYSLNQATVKNADKVEFFIYRDSWAMDNYCTFSYNNTNCNSITAKKGEILEITLKGYPFGWYSCYEESELESMISPIGNAIISVDGEKVTTTKEDGSFTLSFDSVGHYTISIKEGEGLTPLIPGQLEVDVFGVELEQEDNETILISNLPDEMDAMIFTAVYENDAVVSVTSKKATLPKGYSRSVIENPSENCRVFVWNTNLAPLTGGALN